MYTETTTRKETNKYIGLAASGRKMNTHINERGCFERLRWGATGLDYSSCWYLALDKVVFNRRPLKEDVNMEKATATGIEREKERSEAF